MTIDEAIAELINATDFKNKLKSDSTLRSYLTRINKGTANLKVKIDLLISFGYIISVESPYKLVRRKEK